MNEPFKFRYVSRLAGVFVLSCLALLVLSILFAGKKQNWFEPKYVFVATAKGEEGAYGLRPGSVVQLSNTPIGKVTDVELVAIGHTEITISISEKYKAYVDTNSRLIVRKTYQLAGNATVEIIPGKTAGLPLGDVDTLPISSDQEFMETAREFLEEAKSIGLPIIKKFDELLANLNTLTQSINEGQGPVGHLLHDATWSGQVGSTLTNLNAASRQISPMLDQAEVFSKKAVTIAENLETVSKNAEVISDDFLSVSSSLKKESENLDGLLLQVKSTLYEIERLTKGVQKHWLVRKYIDDDPAGGPMMDPVATQWLMRQFNMDPDLAIEVPGSTGGQGMSLSDAMEFYAKQLQAARVIDNRLQSGVAAHNLAACQFAAGQRDDAETMINSALLELSDGSPMARSLLLKAVITQNRVKGDQFREMIRKAEYELKGSRLRQLETCASLLEAASWIDDKEIGRARDLLDKLHKKIGDDERFNADLRLACYDLLRQTDDSLKNKARYCDHMVDAARQAGLLSLLPSFLLEAGNVWSAQGNQDIACDRFYRSARTAFAQGSFEAALVALNQAKASKPSHTDQMSSQFKWLEREIRAAQTGGS
jgi:ABC-type transporter Mla subunit MlaD